jgi:hypothetical protein
MGTYFSRRAGLLAFLLISAIYVLAIVPAPGISLPSALYDDGLFMKWSVSILNGQWLGPWDNLTTSKGPLHSLLTSAAASLGVNPFAYKKLFYLAGSVVFVATGLRNAPVWLRGLTLATLLLDPFQYSSASLRNLREGTYIPLQLIAFGLGSWSLDQLRAQSRIRPRLVAAIIGTATCFGLILVTREARLIAWLEISTWLLLGICLVLRRYRFQLGHHFGIKISACLLSVFLIILWTNIPVIVLGALNSSYYDARISNSIEEGEFPFLYGRLLTINVKGEAFIPRVSVKNSTIDALVEQAAKGSPLLNILKGIPSEWAQSGNKIYPETKGEIAGGWFMWALRDGIATSLEPNASEASFQRIVRYANRELASICRQSKTLRCDPPKVGYLQSFSRWGFSRPIQEIAKEGKRISSLVLIPSMYPLGSVSLDSSEYVPQAIASALKIKRACFPDCLKWHRIFTIARALGALGKLSLILLFLGSAFLVFNRLGPRELLDLVGLWLVFALCLHLATYTLLGLTSFPGDDYVIMASPLFIGLLARFSAISVLLINNDIGHKTHS